MKVPCGKCRWCKVAKSREWALRVTHELPYHEHSLFATLTYRDEDLPLRASLSKEVAVNFLKRLRSIYAPHKLRYLISGEYGNPQNGRPEDPYFTKFLLRGFGRPHYHAILFGVSLEDHELSLVDPSTTEKGWQCLKGPLNDAWGYGFIVVGVVTYKSARYCVKYMQKCFTEEVNHRLYAYCQPPFQLQSKGLGKEYALEYSDQIVRNLSCKLEGTSVGLPRYYAKLLITPSAINTLRLHARAHDSSLASRYRLEAKEGLTEGWQQNDALERERLQQGKNILAKLRNEKGSTL